MKDNEIIKALECCLTIEGNSCGGCPVEKGCITDEGVNVLHKHALDLINRQQAEIERYKGVIKLLEKDVLTAKTEAVKEFAERLKSLQIGLEISGESLYYIPIDCIDNLVKEMTEQSVNYGSSKTEGNG